MDVREQRHAQAISKTRRLRLAGEGARGAGLHAAQAALAVTVVDAAQARRAGIDVVVTSFLDSSLGIAAALHFAASLPESPFAAGLATAELLADDLAAPFPVAAGAIALPGGVFGLGVAPDGSALRRCATGVTRKLRA